MPLQDRRPPRSNVEWEFDRVSFSREFPRGVVTKLLVERAEHGGWELDRVRIGDDGVRRKDDGAVGVHRFGFLTCKTQR